MLDHAQLSRELAAIASAHPDIAQLQTIGSSRAGRALEALRFAGRGASEDAARPALLLVANLDGARLYSSAVALQHARALAEGYASNPAVQSLLDTTTVWILPRANPDAAEARFAVPRFEQRASGPGIDDDRDGRAGEDPPSDINGDGVIGWMRVADPDGEWRLDPTDARARVKAERSKGERGAYKLWPEGRDSDRDDLVAEDALLDARVDKNFPAGWEQHTREAGLFPTDEPETRALCDFVLAHAELALVVVYDAQDSLVGELESAGDEAPRVKLIPPEGVLESDAKLLGELGKRYRKATQSAVKSEASERGSFARWCYEQRGLWTLSAALWDLPLTEAAPAPAPAPAPAAASAAAIPPVTPTPAESTHAPAAPATPADQPTPKPDEDAKPSDDAKRLRWIDARGASEAWRFLPWTPFTHPELGAVEIGGLAPYARLEPPASESAAIAQRHFEWFLTLGALLPRVSIAECTREPLGEGLQRVHAVLENDAFLPLLSRAALRSEALRPARLRLVLPEGAVLLGGESQALCSELPGSGGRAKFDWLVRAAGALELRVSVDSSHAGRAQRSAEVKP